MIKNPQLPKLDRLSAFFRTFELQARPCGPAGCQTDASLAVVADAQGQPAVLALCPGGRAREAGTGQVLLTAWIGFGGAANPLVGALPARLEVALADAPALRAVCDAFLAEAQGQRCGRDAALDRLCEVMVLMLLRHAIDHGLANRGLLAGLAHPALHRALVAVHEAPARTWRVDELAEEAGMSRSSFIALFGELVGTTPAAYLTGWRLRLARRALAQGARVKSVAHSAGFASAAAFSRAYSRQYGQPPAAARTGG